MAARVARCSSLLLVVLALGGWFGASSARAQISYSLDWARDRGAESCLSSEQLAALVATLVPEAERVASGGERAIEGLVQRETGAGRFRVRVRVLDERGRELGERTLESGEPSCSALDRKLALVLALALSPSEPALPLSLPNDLTLEREPGALLLEELARREAEPQVVAPPQTTAVAQPAVPAAQVQHERSPSLLSRLHSELSAAALLALSRLPSASPGLRLTGRVLLPRRLALELASSYFAPRVAQSELGGVSVEALDGSLAACGSPYAARRLRWDVCAGTTLGARFGEGRGLEQGRSLRRRYYGPLASSNVHLNFGRWFGEFGASLSALWPRDRFGYDDPADRYFAVYRPTRLSATLGLGFGVPLR